MLFLLDLKIIIPICELKSRLSVSIFSYIDQSPIKQKENFFKILKMIIFIIGWEGSLLFTSLQ